MRLIAAADDKTEQGRGEQRCGGDLKHKLKNRLQGKRSQSGHGSKNEFRFRQGFPPGKLNGSAHNPAQKPAQNQGAEQPRFHEQLEVIVFSMQNRAVAAAGFVVVEGGRKSSPARAEEHEARERPGSGAKCRF